jgi:hypothetical protein
MRSFFQKLFRTARCCPVHVLLRGAAVLSIFSQGASPHRFPATILPCASGGGNSLTGVIPARGRHRGGSGDLPAGAAQYVSVLGGLRRTFPGAYISLKNAPPDGVVQFGGAYAGNRIICRGASRLFRRGPRRAGSWRRSYPVRRSGSSTECPVRRNPWPPGCRNAAVR